MVDEQAANKTVVGVGSGSGTVLTSDSVAAIPYSYTVDTASSVKSIVTAGAGTGKITG